MFQAYPTTGAFPAVGIAVHNNGVPVALLPCQLDQSISGHGDFVSGCQFGVETFEDLGFSTPNDVQDFVVSEVRRRYSDAERVWGVPSLPWRVGYCLGFLSVLAGVRSDLAWIGLGFLSSLVPCQYREEAHRGYNPLAFLPGLRSRC
jgi:hypothetical protein